MGRSNVTHGVSCPADPSPSNRRLKMSAGLSSYVRAILLHDAVVKTVVIQVYYTRGSRALRAIKGTEDTPPRPERGTL